MNKRRRFSPQFKAQVVLEALQGDTSQAATCRKHDLSPDLLSRWRQQFLEQAHLVFATSTNLSAGQSRIAELERLVRQLTFKLAAAKKLSALLQSRWPGDGR